MIKKVMWFVAAMLILVASANAYIPVRLGPEYIPDPTRSRSVSAGSIYIGSPGTDPTIEVNQIQMYVQEEDGDIIAVTQPVLTGAGGVPVYLGSPVSLLAAGDYSLTILDKHDAQVYYVPDSDVSTVSGSQLYPDYTAADQGVTGDNNTIKYYIDAANGDAATIHLLHNSGGADTTYTLTTSETLPSNITFTRENGAIIDGAGTLTVNGGFDVGLGQCFGPNITFVFGQGAIEESYSEWVGGAGDGTVDSGAAINKMLTAGQASHIPVKLLDGTYIIETPLIIYNLSVLTGQGAGKTTLNLKDNANLAVMKSYGFDSLTGQNKWLTSDGVVHGFTLKGFSIDGNKANQSAGYGMSLYAKRYNIDDVIILDAKQVGYYSEAGSSSGQNDWTDLPEANVDITIRNCDGNGAQIRGPHDFTIKRIISALNGGDGVLFQQGATYAGSGSINLIHSYSNAGHGINVDAGINADQLIGESNVKSGVYFDTNSNRSQITSIHAYSNDSGNLGNRPEVNLLADELQIGTIRTKNIYTNGDGVDITGDGNAIGSIVAVSTVAATGNGVSVDGNNNTIGGGRVTGFTGVGAKGLLVSPSGAVEGNQVTLSLANNNTDFRNVTAGKKNHYDLAIATGASYTMFSGVGPTDSEFWDIASAKSGVTYRTENKGTKTIVIGTSSIVVDHGLLLTPANSDVQITPVNDPTARGVINWWVDTLTATQFTINVDANVTTNNLSFAWKADL